MVLHEVMEKLTKDELISLVYTSLDNMQAYNGRTREWCILDAMGAVEAESEGAWKLPKLEDIKKKLESYI